MAVPKKRLSKTRRDKRRSHLGLHVEQPTLCAHCKQPKVAHRICSGCGYYGGVEIIQPEE